MKVKEKMPKESKETLDTRSETRCGEDIIYHENGLARPSLIKYKGRKVLRDIIIPNQPAHSGRMDDPPTLISTFVLSAYIILAPQNFSFQFLSFLFK